MLNDQEIVQLRLLNQRISLPAFTNPAEVVGWLGAVQAQDYYGAKWALGLRMRDATDHQIEEAFNAGTILRTHVLRPTWHFVLPADIRWMLALTAPRVHAASAYMHRQQKLDESVFRHSDEVLAKALSGGRYMTRDELKEILEGSAIPTNNGVRMSYLMMHAELEGIICSGPRRGKQFTYALLEERAPQAKSKEREEALAELSRRFFQSRGPATDQDYAKWSGLTLADARDGLEAVKEGLEHETMDGQTYWFLRPRTPLLAETHTAHLLSIYDEYISGYKDRSAIDGQDLGALLNSMGNALQFIVIVNGQFVGTWKRAIRKEAVTINLNKLSELSEAEYQAVSQAAQDYGKFLGLPVVLES